jgi:DNA helicase-2/ATP-dependent DNA helicase PcrA
VEFCLAADETFEAREIVRHIRAEVGLGRRLWRDFAVLYRTNAQSRAVEEAMRDALLPYRLVGGVYFYQRREIRDLLAYLRLLVNPADEESLRRALAAPRRGVGEVSFGRFLEFARGAGLDPAAALPRAEEAPGVPVTAARELAAFGALLAGTPAARVDEALRSLLEASRFLQHVEGMDPATAQSRLENVEELVAGAARFAESSDDPSVERYLSEISLYTDLDRWDESADAVTLMTVHNAKGLEFREVIVAGLEEGLFPHASSLGDPGEIEEERRLFYVAVTRAEERAVLLAAVRRHRFGRSDPDGEVSRFVREIPEGLLAWREPAAAPSPGLFTRRRAPRTVPAGDGRRYVYDEETPPPDESGLVGARVTHARFGAGIVMQTDGTGPDARVVVQFHAGFRKKLVARYLDWEE